MRNYDPSGLDGIRHRPAYQALSNLHRRDPAAAAGEAFSLAPLADLVDHVAVAAAVAEGAGSNHHIAVPGDIRFAGARGAARAAVSDRHIRPADRHPTLLVAGHNRRHPTDHTGPGRNRNRHNAAAAGDDSWLAVVLVVDPDCSIVVVVAGAAGAAVSVVAASNRRTDVAVAGMPLRQVAPKSGKRLPRRFRPQKGGGLLLLLLKDVGVD